MNFEGTEIFLKLGYTPEFDLRMRLLIDWDYQALIPNFLTFQCTVTVYLVIINVVNSDYVYN